MQSPPATNGLRLGEETVELPERSDAGVYFIGVIHTPWRTRRECPRRGDPKDGPVCTIVIDERWRGALAGIASHKRLQLLYWMHEARRDLVLQTPFQRETTGTFALRSPARPNPIASSYVELIGVDGAVLRVRGLDCLDGTPLVDLKPEHGANELAG
jgi:tRNA-Thr(GGU) m(6)t(6)A37 methyltransferase TsaA